MSVLSIKKQVIETKDIEQKVPAKNKANKKINSYSHQSSCLKEIKVFADLINNDTLKQNKKYYFEKKKSLNNIVGYSSTDRIYGVLSIFFN